MSITIYPSQFNMREDGGYEQLPAIKGETGEQGVPGVGALPGGTAGQVPVKQSADDYDVAWEDIGWTKVWENASPTSAFAAQTASLDLSGYKELIIQFNHHIDTPGTVYSSYVFVGQSTRLFRADMYGTTIYISWRQAGTSTAGVVFANGQEGSQSTALASSSNICVPIAIYAR